MTHRITKKKKKKISFIIALLYFVKLLVEKNQGFNKRI